MINVHEIKTEGYTGTVSYEVLNAATRLRELGKMQFKLKTDGVVVEENTLMGALLIEAAAPYIKEVDIIRLEDGYEIKSYEAILLSIALSAEVANAVFTEIKLGKI